MFYFNTTITATIGRTLNVMRQWRLKLKKIHPRILKVKPVSRLPLFYESAGLKLYHQDFIHNTLPSGEIDLIVTSPPYNLDIDYGKHDDGKSYDAYLEFTLQWLSVAFRMSKSDGRMCLNVPLDKNKGGQQSTLADITAIAKRVGWRYHSTIIWNEGNISRRTAWGSWMSASAPYVIAPVETILVLYKDVWKKQTPSEFRVNDITRDEFIAWTNGLWTFNGESKKRIGHPAPFPRDLPRRCIKLFSFVGQTVLDPFAGSSTTLLEARANNRIGIGFDVSLEYCQLSKSRLIKSQSTPHGQAE
jgi:site-specific DNA-methyltransferase (adenine-specific)